ncbi:carboxymuconolactone decarboxylase [Moniliophthora roreri]|nr:carboxymuconolactone decarboxylase [Moniliophthora roreri]
MAWMLRHSETLRWRCTHNLGGRVDTEHSTLPSVVARRTSWTTDSCGATAFWRKESYGYVDV